MRNTYLKEIRHDFKDSRFFYGKNRVMAKALGTTAEEEYKEGLSAIAKVITKSEWVRIWWLMWIYIDLGIVKWSRSSFHQQATWGSKDIFCWICEAWLCSFRSHRYWDHHTSWGTCQAWSWPHASQHGTSYQISRYAHCVKERYCYIACSLYHLYGRWNSFNKSSSSV